VGERANERAVLTIEEVLAMLPGLTERALKEELRAHGCASEIRGKLFVSAEQLKRFLKETELCPSSSSNEAASTTSAELLRVNAYAKALELVTQKTPSASERRQKRVSSAQTSTDQKTKRRSLTLVSSISRQEGASDISNPSSGTSGARGSKTSSRPH
jgi:hypothetical protein